ncbi:MAG TPA: SMC family ATPase [Bryobacteraceae bacterium]|nr:SMC family ATPase [Bryobacteraceae bacterium]
MTVSHLAVEKFRCFVSRTELRLDPEGVTVICGPNGSGKSTLLHALLMVLANPHTAGGKAMEALRPWGTDLAPEISAIFDHNGGTWRVWKRFLSRPECRLENRTARGGFALVAEGKAADRKLEEMLGLGHVSGAAGIGHLGWMQVLWAPQGEVAMPELSGRALEDVRAILGAQLGGPLGARLEQWIEGQYLELWTGNGRPRKAREQEQARLAAMRQALEEARQRLDRVAQLSRAVELTQGEAQELKHRVARMRGELEKAEREEKDAQFLRMIAGNLEAQCRLVESRHQELKRRIERIEALTRQDWECRQRIHSLEASVREKQEAAWDRLKWAEAARERAEALGEECERLRARAQRALGFAQLLRERDEIRHRLRRIEELAEHVDRERGALEALRAPSDAELARMRELQGRWRELEVRLESCLLKVELVPETEGSVEVLAGEPAGRHALKPGAGFEVRSEGRAEIRIPGFGLIRVAGPETPAAQLRQDRDAVASHLEEMLRRLGATDLAEAEARHARLVEIRNRVAQLEAEQRTLLAGSSAEEWKQRAGEHEAEIAAIVGQFPEWTAIPAAESRQLAEQAERELQAKSEELRTARKESEETLDRWRLTQMEAEREAAALERTREELERTVSELTSLASDGRSAEQRAEELHRLELEWRHLKSEREKAEDELARCRPEGAARLREEIQNLEERAAQAEQRRVQAEADLRALLSSAPYDEYIVLEEQTAQLERKIEATEVQAEAIRRVREAVRAAKQEALEGLAEPVAEEAARILLQIAGRRLGSLKIGENLSIQHLEPPAAGRPVDLHELSGGEQEQIHLAVRLALARFLARSERQLVVLDDAFMFTDDERLGRLLDLIGELRAALQIVILTCHPERLRGLPGARFVRLQNFELVGESGGYAPGPDGSALSSFVPDAGRVP